MDLLTNAIESIQVGIEDYRVASRPRLLSAVRNIHAGILLLYKEALLRRSPDGSNEVLVKARIRPVPDVSGGLRFTGVGKNTVDAKQIKEHFESLGISTDWSSYAEIARVRNDIEHYYPNVTADSLKGLVTSACLLIRSFTTNELEEDPLKLLGQETWQLMLDVADVYQAERRECDEAADAIHWGSETLLNGIRKLRCPSCASDLLRSAGGEYSYAEATLTCRGCGEEQDAETFIPDAVALELEMESYLAAKDGDDEPIAECPDCGGRAYVIAESRCALCGSSAEHTCARCGHKIPASEFMFSPLCSYCSHMMSKDD